MASYEHVLVSNIKEPQPEQFFIKRGQETYPKLDGYPVPKELMELGNALRQTPGYRGCKFGVQDTYDTKYPGKEIYVYFPNQLYTVGTIGHGNYAVGENPLYRYCVSSRSVVNNKYRHGSDAQRWALSKNLDKAVSNARKHLKVYGPHDIVDATLDNFRHNMSNKAYEYNQKTDTAFSALEAAVGNNCGDVYAELVYLVNAGYEFKVAGVKEMIVTAMEAVQEADEARNKKMKLSLIYTLKSPLEGVEPNVCIVDGPTEGISVMGGGYAVSSAFGDWQEISRRSQVCLMSELPTEFTGAVSLLSMVEDNTFVEGVGYRLSSEVFYVFTD